MTTAALVEVQTTASDTCELESAELLLLLDFDLLLLGALAALVLVLPAEVWPPLAMVAVCIELDDDEEGEEEEARALVLLDSNVTELDELFGAAVGSLGALLDATA